MLKKGDLLIVTNETGGLVNGRIYVFQEYNEFSSPRNVLINVREFNRVKTLTGYKYERFKKFNAKKNNFKLE